MNISKFITTVFLSSLYTSSIWGTVMLNGNICILSKIILIIGSFFIVAGLVTYIAINWGK